MSPTKKAIYLMCNSDMFRFKNYYFCVEMVYNYLKFDILNQCTFSELVS